MTALFEVDIDRSLRIPVEGGRFHMSGILYRPRTLEPVPALVTVTPYRSDAGAGIESHAMHMWFAARGYACLLVDVRGTGSSGGPLRPPFDPAEADDAIAASDWALAQSWCTGTVGMWGTSYCAMLTMRAALRRPAGLRAIVPILGMTDPERDVVHPAGAWGCGAALEWGTATALNQVMPELAGLSDATDVESTVIVRDDDPWILEMFRRSPGDRAWRDSAFDVSALEVPALVVAGWRDLFCSASIGAYESMTGPKKLLVGPWAHEHPWLAGVEAIDLWSIVLDWWDHWLRGIDRNVMAAPAVTVFKLGGSSGWHTASSWPGPGLRQLIDADVDAPTLPTNARRDLAESGRTLNAITDPTVGSQSGLWWSGGMGGAFSAPQDQHDDDRRSLTYTTEPLHARMVLVGRPRVVVTWEDEVPARLVVRLTDVDAHGRSILVAQGLVTSLDAGSTAIELSPTCFEVGVGHRLRLVLSTADFPRLWPMSPSQGRVADTHVAPTVTVAAPVMEARFLVPVEMPRPHSDADDGLLRRWTPEWTTTRDQASDAIEHRWGSTLDAITADGAHRLVLSASHVAHTGPDDPGASTALATRRAEIHTPDAETVVVSVTTSMTAGGMEVSATVDVGAIPAFQHTWRCERREGHKEVS